MAKMTMTVHVCDIEGHAHASDTPWYVCEIDTLRVELGRRGDDIDEWRTTMIERNQEVDALRASLAEARKALLEIRDKYLPAIRRDAPEADKTICHVGGLAFLLARVVPACDFPSPSPQATPEPKCCPEHAIGEPLSHDCQKPQATTAKESKPCCGRTWETRDSHDPNCVDMMVSPQPKKPEGRGEF